MLYRKYSIISVSLFQKSKKKGTETAATEKDQSEEVCIILILKCDAFCTFVELQILTSFQTTTEIGAQKRADQEVEEQREVCTCIQL